MELYQKQAIAEEIKATIETMEQALELWLDNDEKAAIEMFNISTLSAKKLSRRFAFLRKIARAIDEEKVLREMKRG